MKLNSKAPFLGGLHVFQDTFYPTRFPSSIFCVRSGQAMILCHVSLYHLRQLFLGRNVDKYTNMLEVLRLLT